ncbi:MAG: alanine racemase [Ignavibacteriales bacterium]
MRKTFAEINLKNLQHNFLEIKKIVKSKKVLAVVKADAYGHGVIKCVKSLLELKEKSPDYFGVALLEEGIEIRKSINSLNPVLLFSPFDVSEFPEYLKYNLIPTVSSEEQIKKIVRLKPNKKIRVHINIDTGMGRLGLQFENAVENIIKLSKIKNVIIDGVYTHFASSDEEDPIFTLLQIEKFKSVLYNLSKQNISYGLAHAANSAAIFKYPESYFDMVRPGISLYGYHPVASSQKSSGLRPVMSLISFVSTIRNVKKGNSVSYGRLFSAEEDSLVGSLPIGYADGVNRNLTQKINIIIKNKLFPQIGRITMDRIMFDTKNDKVKVGNRAILLGKTKSHEIDAWDWSKILNTIPYEITCGISKRVPRIFYE